MVWLSSPCAGGGEGLERGRDRAAVGLQDGWKHWCAAGHSLPHCGCRELNPPCVSVVSQVALSTCRENLELRLQKLHA